MFRNVWSVFTSQTSEVGFVYCMWLSISKGLWMYYKSKGCIFVTQNSAFEWVTSSPTLPKLGKRLYLLLVLGERNLPYCQAQIFHKGFLTSLITLHSLFWGFLYLSPSPKTCLTPRACGPWAGYIYVSMWESVGKRILKAFCKSLDVSGCRWMQA